MKKFIEKLIGRLEEVHYRNNKMKKKAYKEKDWERFDLLTHRNEGIYGAIEIVNQLAEEYNNGWIICSSGEMPKCGEFDIKKVWVTMHRKGIDFYFTRKVCWNNYHKRWEWENGKEMADVWQVIAWMYIEVPAPYHPKGE